MMLTLRPGYAATTPEQVARLDDKRCEIVAWQLEQQRRKADVERQAELAEAEWWQRVLAAREAAQRRWNDEAAKDRVSNVTRLHR